MQPTVGEVIETVQHSHSRTGSVVVEEEICQQHEERHRVDGVGADRLRQRHQDGRQDEAERDEYASRLRILDHWREIEDFKRY